MMRRAAAPGFWTIVVALLRAARLRSVGRLTRQTRLRRQRGGRMTSLWPIIGFVTFCLFGAMIHAGAALDLMMGVPTAERVQAEYKGRVVVEEWFAGRTEEHEAEAARLPASRNAISRAENDDIAVEASRLVRNGGDAKTIEARLRDTIRRNPKALVAETSLWWQPGALPDIVALVIVLWWALMLVCQGEGLTLDMQRSRDPMWEWLFSHPAPPAAIFLAELLAPIAANPAYLTVPVFPGILFGWAYDWPGGLAGAILVGIPIMVALAYVGKAIEIRVALRLRPRARGAVLGLMSWFGFMAMLLLFMAASSLPSIVETAGRWLAPYGDAPWPPMRRLLGFTDQGNYVFWRGVLWCWLVAALLIVAAVALCVVSTRGGLVAPSGAPTRRAAAPARSWKMALYRKEFLWFRRDGRALVQAFLVPLSLAALQAFNLRGMMGTGTDAWSTTCGIAVLFGTYFLITLGPTSLASEGQALWIAQTWPHGLESLLKTKAKLWTWVASAIVGIVLIYAAWRFPADIVGIVGVGILWVVFARSLAEKTVTLATTTSSSGEVEALPAGLRAAALLGTLTFAIGVLTRQWNIAIAGVVYSVMTAAAMWQNFRHRLPYLADPWSETIPPAPTLLHAMVTISAMIESVSILSGIALLSFGTERIVPINAALYGLCAIAAALLVGRFLARRGVLLRDIWLWRDGAADIRPFFNLDAAGKGRVVFVVAGAAALGAALGSLAHLYLAILHHAPDIARLIDEGRRQIANDQTARWASAAMAVAVAPLAEEFLFRGLLYRALDREWHGWRAILGAAAFFAAYHPVLSWAPVGLLGIVNAVLFQRTKRLAPAVAAHIAYNAVILTF